MDSRGCFAKRRSLFWSSVPPNTHSDVVPGSNCILNKPGKTKIAAALKTTALEVMMKWLILIFFITLVTPVRADILCDRAGCREVGYAISGMGGCTTPSGSWKPHCRQARRADGEVNAKSKGKKEVSPR
jgi:hypothetical protein